MDIRDVFYEKTYNFEKLLELINDTIKSKKLTKRKIALDLNLYPQNFSNFLKGKSPLSIEKTKTLLDYLGL